MEEKKSSDGDYGTITVGFGTHAIREVPIKSFVQARFLDNRLATIMTVEDAGVESYIIAIENPESTGRSTQKMWLSEETLTAFSALSIVMYGCQGKDFKALIEKSLEGGDKSSIKYSCSQNLKPFDNNPPQNPENEKMG